MEAKKNPACDVHRQSFRYFLIGLGISIGIIISAFEWTTEKKMVTIPNDPPSEEVFIPVLATRHEPIEQVPVTKPKVNTAITFPNASFVASDPSESQSEIPTLDENYFTHSLSSFGLPAEEDTTQIVVIEEVAPKPVGGYASFYHQLAKNLKYPRQAVRQGVEGNIFVEFVVDKTGKVTQLGVVKGIGSGCDEEAVRLLATTRWEPGRQRGKPVNVRMVLPIKFQLRD
jgi:protein TonB